MGKGGRRGANVGERGSPWHSAEGLQACSPLLLSYILFVGLFCEKGGGVGGPGNRSPYESALVVGIYLFVVFVHACIHALYTCHTRATVVGKAWLAAAPTTKNTTKGSHEQGGRNSLAWRASIQSRERDSSRGGEAESNLDGGSPTAGLRDMRERKGCLVHPARTARSDNARREGRVRNAVQQ